MASIEITELALSGCYLLRPAVFTDARGTFVKPFVKTALATAGLRTDFVEQYCSTSGRGVIRGMHFQLPPHDHAKLVYCLAGEIEDVLLDLRKESSTYGQAISVRLNGATPTAVYMVPGVAHGFVSIEAPGLMVYNVTSEYAPDHDTGVRWDSFGYEWPVSEPLMSERDRRFGSLADFQSPF